MRVHRLLLLLLAVLTAGLLLPPKAAVAQRSFQPYAPQPPSLIISITTVFFGTIIIIRGRFFGACDQISISITTPGLGQTTIRRCENTPAPESDRQRWLTADQNGNFVATARMTRIGLNTIRATGFPSGRSASASVRVLPLPGGGAAVLPPGPEGGLGGMPGGDVTGGGLAGGAVTAESAGRAAVPVPAVNGPQFAGTAGGPALGGAADLAGTGGESGDAPAGAGRMRPVADTELAHQPLAARRTAEGWSTAQYGLGAMAAGFVPVLLLMLRRHRVRRRAAGATAAAAALPKS